MHYIATVDKNEREIEVTESAPGHYHVVLDGKVYQIDAQRVGERTLSLIVQGNAYHIEVECPQEATSTLLVRGHAVSVEVLDLRQVRLRRALGASDVLDGPASMTSPMPGKVIAVLVKLGDVVQEGQGLVVVEAMKMENEIKAPKAGTVSSVNASVGAAVDAGALLCVIV
jgi:biotin carboxyl carrier protein